MTEKRNDLRRMGNCAKCYYFTPLPKKDSDEGVCHRYPKGLDKHRGYYCGEYVMNPSLEPMRNTPSNYAQEW